MLSAFGEHIAEQVFHDHTGPAAGGIEIRLRAHERIPIAVRGELIRSDSSGAGAHSVGQREVPGLHRLGHLDRDDRRAGDLLLGEALQLGGDPEVLLVVEVVGVGPPEEAVVVVVASDEVPDVTGASVVVGSGTAAASVTTNVAITARSAPEAPVTMLRVYCSCPGVSATMNLRLSVEKKR